jgi:hypothetical protein
MKNVLDSPSVTRHNVRASQPTRSEVVPRFWRRGGPILVASDIGAHRSAGASGNAARSPAAFFRRRSCRHSFPIWQEDSGQQVEKSGQLYHVLETERPPAAQHLGGHGIGGEHPGLDKVVLMLASLAQKDPDQLRARDVRDSLCVPTHLT